MTDRTSIRKRAVLGAALFACACPAAAEEIGAEALADLPPADIVILGEVHDNPAHHANQAAAVGALAPAAIVLEMVGPEAAARGNAADRSDRAAMDAALGWAGSGWPDFALYHPVLTAAPDAPLYGAALDRDVVSRAVAEGAADVFPGDAARYGLDRALPPDEQAARDAEQVSVHCDALPAEMAPGMVEAQRLRDAALADAALAALSDTGGPVVVIAGAGHARTDWGVPALIALAAPDVRVLSIGQIEVAPGDPAPDASSTNGPPFDLWIATPPADRDDPCAAFR